ncbi:MAG: [FeFe] hydrogenase H-cluster radical SAM maturase HydG [Planctomycetia bacterium]|nr:[FeFe] hydrogenase H-cluster radical SAM maturase HydG [Planctomycetia bacterium]
MTFLFDHTLLSSSAVDFVDAAGVEELLQETKHDLGRFREVLAKSKSKEALTEAETAVLLAADTPECVEEIFEVARQLKKDVYGNRIVIFAPIYVGNYCRNDCVYCAFRRSNPECDRMTLSDAQLENEVREMLRQGHKRTIAVFGESHKYNAAFIAQCVEKIYAVQEGNSSIRRVNINAAPMDHEGFRIIHEAGIGTYQIFQETYHKPTYAKMHPAGTEKADFMWRLDSLSRAYESGADDVGLGALFGLYDWRFEVLGLVAHSRHLMNAYGCGPHTISFPRIRPASGIDLSWKYDVSDDDFKRLVAILRLSVPYTGLICTARENAHVRRSVMDFGVSQIDAGSRIELGGYSELGEEQVARKEQFELGDMRSLDTIICELLEDDLIPSFCTACYRKGRTGQQFMEYAIPGFIQRLCTPNALTTLQEYLTDYASEKTRNAGEAAIMRQLEKMDDGPQKRELISRLERISETEERDLYF